MKIKKAFTLVEILVVISILAILTSFAVVTFVSIQKDSRDSTRKSNVTIISEALEKYYEKNGEYPSVASLSSTNADRAAVVNKLSIPESALKMPRTPSSVSNPITHLSEGAHNFKDDEIEYAGQSATDNNACQNDVNAGCDEFTLKYKEEAGDVVAIESRHRSRIAADPTPDNPTAVNAPSIAVRAQGTNIEATATFTKLCGNALTYKYSFSYRTRGGNDPSYGGWSAFTAFADNPIYTIPGVQGTSYEVKVKARCDRDSIIGDESPESVARSAVYPIAAPSPGPATTIDALGDDIVGTGSTITSCVSGSTTQYSIQGRINSGSYNSWSAWSNSVPILSLARSGTNTYTFHTKARCVMTNAQSPETVGSDASITLPAAPTGLSVSAYMDGNNAAGASNGGTCVTGTLQDRQMRVAESNTAAVGTYTSYTNGSALSINPGREGYRYTFQHRARCVNGNVASGWAESGTDATVRPINAPSTPSISYALNGEGTTWTMSTTCPTGTTRQYQGSRSANHPTPVNGTWGPQTGSTYTWNPTLDGHTYIVQAQARCTTVHATSGWSGTTAASNGTSLRPVSVPTNESSITFSTAFTNNRYIRWIYYPPPTCRNNAVPVYRWNSYMQGFSWESAPGSGGWYYGNGSTFASNWSGEENDAPENPNYFRSPSLNQYPNPLYGRHRVQYRCKNTFTNELSSWGTVRDSGTITFSQ